MKTVSWNANPVQLNVNHERENRQSCWQNKTLSAGGREKVSKIVERQSLKDNPIRDDIRTQYYSFLIFYALKELSYVEKFIIVILLILFTPDVFDKNAKKAFYQISIDILGLLDFKVSCKVTITLPVGVKMLFLFRRPAHGTAPKKCLNAVNQRSET